MRVWETILEVAERRGNFLPEEKEKAEYWAQNPTGEANIERDKVGKPIAQRWVKMSLHFIDLIQDPVPDFEEIRKYLGKIYKEVDLTCAYY